MQEVAGAACGHRATLRIGERQRVQSFAPQQGQQGVPGRVKFERVDALAAWAEREQLRSMAIRDFGERQRLRRGQRRAVAQQRLAMPRAAIAFERLPSLFFRRWICTAFLLPSGAKRGTKKQDRPS